MIQFTIQQKMLSVNQWASLHWSKKGSYKKQIEKTVWAICKSNKFKVFNSPVCIEIVGVFKDSRTRDIDNYSGGSTTKAILDGLVCSGILEDDSSEYVTAITIRLEQGDENSIRITIKESGGQA